MAEQGTIVLGSRGIAITAAATFLVALTLAAGLEFFCSTDSFRLGLSHLVTAVLLSGLAALAVGLRERALAVRLEALDRQSAQTASELKHQTGLAQGILSGLPVPFLLVDEQERAVSSNMECLQMLELDGKPQDYYGQTLAQIFYNDPARKTAVGRSIKDGEVFRNLEVAIKGHKGGTRNVLANVFPLYDTDKRCIGGLCLYLDMTALKQNEQVILEKNESIGKTAVNANALCARLRDASNQLSASIGQTTRGSEAQKVRVGEIGVSMDQMSTAVVDVAKNASSASQGADAARQQAEQGERVVGEVIAAIRSVSERTQAMQERLTELGGQVEGIGQILSVINDIADQTNLLALNAAIEAARAGDAGRGFAVVADEVRKLAEKTVQATQQVATAIRSVQDGARRASEGMTGAVEAVGSSTSLADSAGRALHEILRISQGSADQVRNIATASEEQSASAEEISRAVEQVRAVTDQTAQDMAQASQAVEELARLADELTDIITKMQTC
ncbi:MAG: hypothetical protein A2051_07000 [Desulfovibrionales bacterium GWA2_65_9]|nr:MAG: hypothetical protein A2051_07000 [Desulfovibrionales bacterium GWA2_65_9]